MHIVGQSETFQSQKASFSLIAEEDYRGCNALLLIDPFYVNYSRILHPYD